MTLPIAIYNTYQIEAAKTAIFPADQALVYTTLGLASEAGELAGAYLTAKGSDNWGEKDWDPVLKEIGDIYWYAAAICTALDLHLGDVYQRAEVAETHLAMSRGYAVVAVTEYTGEIAGAVKKYIRDEQREGDWFRGSKYEDKLMVNLSKLLLRLEVLLFVLRSSPLDVMDMNLAKLNDRKTRGVLGGSGDNR